MRKLLILFFLALGLQTPLGMLAQGISLEVQDATLENVFNLVQRQSPYRFVYASEDLAATKKVTVSLSNTSIAILLEKIFKDQPVSYHLQGQVIMVSKINKQVPATGLNGLIVNGKVVDEEGNGLPAVTIALTGNKLATATDEKGYFILTGIDPLSVLLVSSVGYETRQIKIEGRTSITIQLFRSVNTLDETVIKGYYNTTRRLNTGAVSKLSAEDIAKQPVSNVLAAMEGRMPGIYIQQNNGVPGSGYNIQIRGQNSLRTTFANNGNLPLYIVDGVPFFSTPLGTQYTSGIIQNGNPLSNISPSDIESIEVLKDADATAIYGSRGANGVILVTTKKAKAGDLTIDISGYEGTGKVARKLDVLNTVQYLQMRREAFLNDGAVPGASDYDLKTWDTTRYTDWQKQLIGGTSHQTNAQVSVSAGNAGIQFIAGGDFYRESTVFPGDFADKKASFHLNVNSSSLNKKFTIGFSVNYMSDINHLPLSDLTTQALTLPPDAPALFTSDGKLNWPPGFRNPYAILLKKYEAVTDNLIGNGVINYRVLPGLNLKVNLGYTQTLAEENNIVPKTSFNPASGINSGYSYFSNTTVKSWIAEPQIEYSAILFKGKFRALAGTSFLEQKRSTQVTDAENFSQDGLLENMAAAGSLTVLNADKTLYRYSAVFLRLNYDWKNKYLINLTARNDGSSRFGPGRKFSNFGAAGLGWVFSKEKYFQFFHFLSFGKLRGSYGITGNDQIGDYKYLNTWSPTNYSYQGSGLYPTNLLNPDYSWEINKKLELAVELGFAHDRILLTADYYRNRSSNQLVGYPLALTTGFSSIQGNLPAVVQNNGWEFELNTVNIKNKNLTWSTGLNISFPSNTLISYPNLAASSYANTYVEGQSLYVRKLFHFADVDPQTGIYRFDNVATKTLTSSPAYPADLQARKSVSQVFYGGLVNNLHYKNWQLDVFIQFVNQTGVNYWYGSSIPPGAFGNQPVMVMNRWQKPGDNSGIQQFTQRNGSAPYNAYYIGQSDAAISDASFVRLKNVSISYLLPDKVKRSMKLKNLSIFLRAQNLFTITHYQGLDPENQSLSHLPPLRMLVAGIKITI